MMYEIYEGFMEQVEKKFRRIENKCAKYGNEFQLREDGEVFKNIVTGKDKNGRDIVETFRYVVVEAEGTARINGWEFVAKVDHTPAGNVFFKALNDVEVPDRYRNSEPFCEHCNKRGYRKNTFIVRNVETGEFKQVGRNCLCDYTHGMSLEFAALVASLRRLFEEAEAYEGNGGYSDWTSWTETNYLLRMAAETVRHFGYQKRYDDYGEYVADNTVSRVEKYIDCRKCRLGMIQAETEREMDNVGFDENSDEAVELAENALEWIKGIEATNDYLKNLQILAEMDCLKENHFGFIISLIPTYQRACERIAREKKEAEACKKSDYIGKVGDKVELRIESGKCVTGWETEYGYTYIYKFVDNNGNVLVWKTAKSIDADRITVLKGAVKEHKEYKGIRQTVLTRCKIEEGR